jgi:hypothetical protein
LRQNRSSYPEVGETDLGLQHWATPDFLALSEQAELLADAMDKVHAPYHFHTVVGGGHNPYFGINTNPKTGWFDTGGGGIGLFEDPAVEPLIIEFSRQ